eukprot:scaffold88_cov387-Prasinococcus_capsulatus_cf.AAC.15
MSSAARWFRAPRCPTRPRSRASWAAVRPPRGLLQEWPSAAPLRFTAVQLLGGRHTGYVEVGHSSCALRSIVFLPVSPSEPQSLVRAPADAARVSCRLSGCCMYTRSGKGEQTLSCLSLAASEDLRA